jgi:protein-L-isoaspartate(D-aspartate) O-methyltransferase
VLGDSLARTRRRFAERIAKRQKITDQRLIEAFASVPRERYLGPGPWHVLRSPGYSVTPNGEPGLHIGLMAHLEPQAGNHVVQVGVGSGYYTAILAHLVRPGGRITAIEYDEELARQASKNLADESDVQVVRADGTSYEFEPADGIYVNAGATRASELWLTNLKPGGRLIMMLTTDKWWGRILKVVRVNGGYAATLLGPCGFIPCINARDPESEVALSSALAAGRMKEVRSLRREHHAKDETCWMHCDGFCLSRLQAG